MTKINQEINTNSYTNKGNQYKVWNQKTFENIRDRSFDKALDENNAKNIFNIRLVERWSIKLKVGRSK